MMCKRQGMCDHPHNRDKHFVYPYNFVPDGGKRREKDGNGGYGKDRDFKKLHRFDGLCGRIEYNLKTLSPIFIPDPEGTTLYKIDGGDEDIHKVMDFFNVKGRLCLPSTSIKGMVRSVVEAATNSSFGVFVPEKKKFSYRKDRGFRRDIGIYSNKQIIPAKIAKLPRKALEDAVKAILGKTPITFDDIKEFQDESIRIKLCKVHTGMPLVVEFEMRGTTFPAVTLSSIRNNSGLIQQRAGNNKRMIVSNGTSYYCPWDPDVYNALGVKRNWPFGNRVRVDFKYADFPEIEAFDPGKNIGKNRVVEISLKGRSGRTKTWSGLSPSSLIGRLLLQKFFIDEEVRSSGIQMSDRYVYVVYGCFGSPIDIEDEVLQDYIDVNKNENPIDNQVVYFERDRSGNIIEFGPVAMFKSAEDKSLEEITDTDRLSQIHYPDSTDKLCPATRLFGWTPKDKTQEQGVAGRVRFSPAWSDKKLEDTIQIPLKILGSPKPQYYPFYLKPEDDSIDPNDRAAYYAGTPSDWAKTLGTIRGRKFYLHHPKAREDGAIKYISRTEYDISPKNRKTGAEAWKNLHTNQNATCAVLPREAEFRGYIEFDSLDPYELGMILWSLTFSDNPSQSSENHAHKLGMGKGIGMGSVKIEIKGVYLEAPLGNWFSMNNDKVDLEARSEERCKTETLMEYVRRFKTWMVTGIDEDKPTESTKYDGLPFVKDLLLIMSLDLAGNNDRIQYHSPAYMPDKGFEYFMSQRKKRRHNKEEPLYTPEAIKKCKR